MTVWHDTIAVFGDVDVVLRAVVVTVCVRVVWNSASDADTTRATHAGITAH